MEIHLIHLLRFIFVPLSDFKRNGSYIVQSGMHMCATLTSKRFNDNRTTVFYVLLLREVMVINNSDCVIDKRYTFMKYIVLWLYTQFSTHTHTYIYTGYRVKILIWYKQLCIITARVLWLTFVICKLIKVKPAQLVDH